MAVSGFLWRSADTPHAPEETMKKIEAINFTELTKRMLLQTFAPASVVTDIKGNILFVHGDTGKYLRPAPGLASLNVVDMARDGLQLELRTAMNTIVTQGLPTLNREVPVKTQDDFDLVSLSMRFASGPGSGANFFVDQFSGYCTAGSTG